MLEQLKKEVYEANISLVKNGLVILTWGNVSGIDRQKGLVVIKPSGVEYNQMTFEDMVVVDLENNVVEGKLKPSSDVETHLVLYKKFEDIKGIAHTHSKWATVFAQAGKGIPPLGTTHADYFDGEVPCTREMTQDEIEKEYEKNTGNIIVETFNDVDYSHVPAVLVHSHGPFVWGSNAKNAVENSFILETIAEIAFYTISLKGLNPLNPISKGLLRKHFDRKHGTKAYYGQI